MNKYLGSPDKECTNNGFCRSTSFPTKNIRLQQNCTAEGDIYFLRSLGVFMLRRAMRRKWGSILIHSYYIE